MESTLEIYERLGVEQHRAEDERIVLTHEQRTRGRLRTEDSQGREVRIFLERGSPLLVGELLKSSDGTYLRVEGAVEELVVATCEDWSRFARACYHLGNRHVKVQVGERWLKIIPDHVLEDMLRGLGMTLSREQDVFVPESGAYSGGHQH